ncbi:MAG: glycosyltransferase family 4 protein [Phormidesmis sp.]
MNNQPKPGVLITGGAWFHESPGGAYKVATEFAEYLAEENYRVFYLAASESDSNVTTITHNGVEVWKYPKPNGNSPSLGNLLNHILYSRRLAKRIYQQYPIKYLNGHDPLQFIGASQALKRHLQAASFSVHSPLVQEHRAHWGLSQDVAQTGHLSLQRQLALKLLSYIESSVYKRADIIQTDSKFTLKEISRDYPKPVGNKGVVRNLWVDLERFRPCQDKQSIRRRLGAPWQDNNSPIFFTIRRLVPRMGLDELIKAVGLLCHEGKSCRLIIGGSGPERENLESLVKTLSLERNVFFLGRVSDEDLPACYQAADCFILPTKALECFGLIILEAFASGIPTIATEVGAIPEIVRQLGNDFLIREAKPQLIAHKMRAFCETKLSVDSLALRKIAESYEYRRQSDRLAKCLLTPSFAK